MKKRFKIIWIIILTIFIVYLIYASAIDIHKELPAVKYRLGDEGYAENIIIKIDGEYKRKLFSADVFAGKIYIEGYEFTNESSGFNNLKSTLADIKIDDDGNGTYNYIKLNSQGDLVQLLQGRIFIKDKFTELTMTIMEEEPIDSSKFGWSSGDGLMISAPAKTRQEALDISNKLMKLHDLLLK